VKSELSLPEPELSPNALTVLESRYLSKDESGGHHRDSQRDAMESCEEYRIDGRVI